jgi:hypothetical protein
MSATPRRLATLVAALIAAATPAAAVASSGIKCTNTDTYGSQCIAITGEGMRVQDIQAWFVPPNRDYLSHRRWALALTRYRCDPIHRTLSECPFVKQWRTEKRRGNPPKDGQTCEVLTPYGVGYERCRDNGVAYASAAWGDWRRFPDLPKTLRGSSTWFCTDLVVRARGEWVRNGAAGSPGVRACAEVHD